MPLLTIFTATYNRCHLIGNLYESLKRQKIFDFEWLVIDDGSSDYTKELFRQIMTQKHPFIIRYYYQENQGLIRSFNRGVSLAKGKYLAKIDSDDYLTDDYMAFVHIWLKEIKESDNIYAVGGLKVDAEGKPLKGVWPLIPKGVYIDATDLERKKYKLDADMSEAWKVSVLRKYPFPVYEKEKFAPEQIAFFKIAIDGYKIRWRAEKLVVCEYQPDGLTLSSKKLVANNPIGYAMMYNNLIEVKTNYKEKLNCALQMIALLFYAKKMRYLKSTNNIFITCITIIPGIILGIRRMRQFKNIRK